MNIKTHIDKIGFAGLLLTAFLSPCCFPLFAFAAATLGFGSAEIFGNYTNWIFEGLVFITLIGLFISYKKHKCLYPIILGALSGLFIFVGYHFIENDFWQYYIYAGMAGLMVATIWNYQRNKLHQTCKSNVSNNMLELNSIITCPNCNFKKQEIMPTNACAYFYECENCKARLKPKQGDCCVYCSYGTVKCPPMQAGNGCC